MLIRFLGIFVDSDFSLDPGESEFYFVSKLLTLCLNFINLYYGSVSINLKIDDTACGYDRIFQFAPQFGKYQMLIFTVGYIASACIYGNASENDIDIVSCTMKVIFKTLGLLYLCTKDIKLKPYIAFCHRLLLLLPLRNIIRTMLTAGVYFQYAPDHRCRSKFENETSPYDSIRNSEILQAMTPNEIKNNKTIYDSCHLVRNNANIFRVRMTI